MMNEHRPSGPLCEFRTASETNAQGLGTRLAKISVHKVTFQEQPYMNTLIAMLWTKQRWPQSVLTKVKSGSYNSPHWLNLQVQCNVSLKKQFQLGSRFQFDSKPYVSIITLSIECSCGWHTITVTLVFTIVRVLRYHITRYLLSNL